MKNLLKIIIGISLFVPTLVNAQVFNQNQVILPTFQGVIMSTSTAGNAKLFASTSPTVNSITATSTTLHSTFPYASTTALSAQSICLTSDICRTTWPTSGSGSFAFPFDPQSWGNSTSTTLGFLNGFLSTASSTVNAPLRLTQLSNGLIAAGIDSLLYNTATGTITCSGSVSCGAGSYVVGSNLIITGSGGGSSVFPFDPVASANATSTTIQFYNGLGTQASSTLGSLYISANKGNTGIGSSSPAQLLSIQGSTLISGNITSVANITATGTVLVADGNVGNPSYSFGAQSSTGIYRVTDGVMGFGTVGGLRLTIRQAGLTMDSAVPIGWSNGAASGALDTAFSRGAAAKIYVGNGTASDFSGTLIATMFGIGTTTPSRTLSVQGNTIISGDIVSVANLTATGTLIVSGTATSTFGNGLQISNGCFAISDGTCLQTYIQNATAYKAAVNYATAAVLSGTPTYSNGSSGVGATLTELGFGALSVDGQAVSAGQRILVKNEATQANNGIYTVTATGSGIASYILTRSTDYNTTNDIYAGTTVPVLSGGTTNGDSQWTESTTGTIIVGTTAIVFQETSFGTNGTVTSVNISAPSFFTVGSPVTTSGNVSFALVQPANSLVGVGSGGTTLVATGTVGSLTVPSINATTTTASQFLRATTTQLTVTGPMYDSTNSPGTSAQVWTSNGVNVAPSWQAAGGAATFFGTTSVQNLATTTLSGLSGGNAYDVSWYASTSPSGGFAYNNLRMCFNTCTVAAGNTYVTNGNRITAANLVVNYEESSSAGVNMANLSALMSSNPTGGDFYSAFCSVDNNSTSIKNGQCTVVGHSNRVTSDSTYTFNFSFTQATAAPITSVSFYMAGTDGPSTFATFATSTRLTAKAL